MKKCLTTELIFSLFKKNNIYTYMCVKLHTTYFQLSHYVKREKLKKTNGQILCPRY